MTMTQCPIQIKGKLHFMTLKGHAPQKEYDLRDFIMT